MLKRLFFLPLFLTLGARGQESMHLGLDKTVCDPKDVLYFRAYLFDRDRLSRLSTNLYVSLYKDSGKIGETRRFPVIGPTALGQITAPDSPGLYWLRCYTASSSTTVSLTVRGRDRPVVVRRTIDEKGPFAVSYVHGLEFSSTYIHGLLNCTLFPDGKTIYDDQPMRVVISYYDTPIAGGTFVFHDRQLYFRLKADSIRKYAGGFMRVCYYQGDSLLVSQHLFIPADSLLCPLRLETDSGHMVLHLLDSGWNYALSVSTIADMPMGNITKALEDQGGRIRDSSFLSYGLRMQTRKKTKTKGQGIALMLQQDSTTMTRVIATDSTGDISLSGLFFYDSTSLSYQAQKNVELVKVDLPEPSFSVPDSNSYELDTIQAPVMTAIVAFDTVKYLKPAYVTPIWQDRNKAIDHRFATGRFANPTRYSWNILKEDLTYTYDLWDFLHKNYLGLSGGMPSNDTPLYNGKRVTFYVDEQVTNWQMLPTHMDEIAYIKILEDFCDDDPFIRMISDIPADTFASFKNPTGKDNTPQAMICIYRREKSSDFAMLPSRLSRICLKGYDRVTIWKRPDRTTLLWAPYVTDGRYVLAIPHTGRPVRIVAEGINGLGQTFHYEQKVAN